MLGKHLVKELRKVQMECCEHYGAEYFPPELDQLVVISDGVYEGRTPIEGVRYPSPERMSGWWLTTDDYNGDVDTLKTVHFSHIVDARPQIAVYMALPFGYRFLFGDEDCVWFEQSVADERP